MAEKKIVDWEAIEREYRAGQLSVVEISRQHGVSRTLVNRKAGKNGWKRDLTDRVRREIKARLAVEDVPRVSDDVSAGVAAANAGRAVEDAASRGIAVLREHRADIARLRRIASQLAIRLEERIANGPGGKECVGDKESLTDALEKLSRIATRITQLERQAFNLNDAPPDGVANFVDRDRLDLET